MKFDCNLKECLIQGGPSVVRVCKHVFSTFFWKIIPFKVFQNNMLGTHKHEFTCSNCIAPSIELRLDAITPRDRNGAFWEMNYYYELGLLFLIGPYLYYLPTTQQPIYALLFFMHFSVLKHCINCSSIWIPDDSHHCHKIVPPLVQFWANTGRIYDKTGM